MGGIEIMTEKYRPVLTAMFQNFIVFLFTYVITILCAYMLGAPAEEPTGKWMESEPLINTIAATTITYCLSIILKNLFVTKRTMYFTIISIGLSIIYTLVYVATHNKVMTVQWFWVGTFVLIAFSLISEMEAIFHTHTFVNKKRYFEMFSA